MAMFRTTNSAASLVCRFLLTSGGLLGVGVGIPKAQAQRDTLGLDVTFIGDREMLLRDAHKILVWPEAAPLPVGKPQFSYNLLAKRLTVEPNWEPVEAKRLDVQQPLPMLYRGYVRAGYGLYQTPLLDASVTDLRSKEGTWGVDLNHHSTRGGLTDVDSLPEVFSTSHAQLWGKRFLRKAHVLEAEGNLQRDVVSYYGQAADSVFVLAHPGRDRYLRMGTGVRWSRWEADSAAIRHEASLFYRHLAAESGTRENNLDFQGELVTYREGERLELGWGANHDRRTYLKPDSTEQTDQQLVLRVSPALITQRGPVSARVGAHITLDARGGQVFHFNPVASASLNILKGLFVPYVQLEGGVDQNRLETVLDRNPLVRPDLALQNTYRKWDLEGGLTGHFARNIHYRGRASYQRFAQYLYFVNDSALQSGLRFQGLYANLTVFTLGGELSMQLGESLTLTGQLDLHTYGTDSQAEAWNLPALAWRAEARYTFQEKLVVMADLAYQGQRKGLSWVPLEGSQALSTPEGTTAYSVDLSRFIDANVSLEYLYNKRMSAWIQLSNVAAARYAVWSGYPVQRFQAMLGFSYAF